MMLEYTVPSRIAIDLYDMNGDLGRIDGSMGFSLRWPRLVFTARASGDVTLLNETILAADLRAPVREALQKIRLQHELDGIILDFRESIPLHKGFGSKTATLLSVAHAYGRIHGVDLDYRALGGLLNRGGTSGLGVNLIDRGGFLLDGGHATRQKNTFAPSSATRGVRPPPILARHPMPDWDVLLVVPRLASIHGEEEAAFFKNTCPLPASDVARIARITLSQVLPAVVEGSLRSFCDGINAVQECSWKQSEIAIYGDKVRNLMIRLRELGAHAVGMSSIGPAIYAVGGPLQEMVERMSNEEFGVLQMTQPENKGVRILRS